LHLTYGLLGCRDRRILPFRQPLQPRLRGTRLVSFRHHASAWTASGAWAFLATAGFPLAAAFFAGFLAGVTPKCRSAARRAAALSSSVMSLARPSARLADVTSAYRPALRFFLNEERVIMVRFLSLDPPPEASLLLPSSTEGEHGGRSKACSY